MPIRWLRAIEKTIAALLSRKIQFFEQYASRAKGLGLTGMGHLYCGQALLDPVGSTFSGKTSII
ncbi:hypothetical protein C3Y91_03690 [Rhizobium sp. UPM1133]|nr:hypothetical protein [Rhizobium ruizarguesonis]